MPSRRQLLPRVLRAAALIVTALGAACATSNVDPSSTPAPPVEPPCNGIQRNGTVVAGHTHTVCVTTSDLSSPPPSSVTYSTSTANDHAHTVSLSPGQLAAVQAGATVTVETSTAIDPRNVISHSHAFTISKTPPPQ